MESLNAQAQSAQIRPNDEPRFRIPRKPINNDLKPQPVSVSPNYSYSSLKGSGNEANSLHRRKRWGFWHDWWLELLCCLLVVSALMAIVGAIYPYQRKELSQWPYSISINTLVAIFTAILKSSMLLVIAEGLSHLKWTWLEKPRPLQDLSRYDSASRGPLGAIRLLISLRGRGLVASVGALLTLLSLAVDPFAQQVVHYYTCTITGSVANAFISRTNSYSEMAGRINAGAGVIPEGAQASINAGIFAPGSVKVQFDCVTGDCVFPKPYHSVGFCSNCTDITQDVSFTNTTTLIPWDNEKYHGMIEADLWTYSLPSGTFLYAMNGSQNLTNFVIAANYTNLLTFDIISIPLLVDGPGAVSPCNATNVTFGCNGIGAAVCHLQPCVNTYSGVVRDGSLNETPIGTWHPLGWGDQYSTTVDISCLSERQHQIILKAGYKIQSGDTWLDCYLTQKSEVNGVSTGEWFLYNHDNFINTNETISADCVYSVSQYLLQSLSYFFDGFLTGNSSMTESDDSAVGPNVVEAIKYAIDNSDNDWYATPSFDSVQNVFNNIAKSYTAHIRGNGDTNASQPAMGYVNRSTTCVHVRWVWLAFPAILASLTILFFVAMIHETRSSGSHHDWKSSPLPMLFHGFDRDAAENHKTTALKQVKDMEDYARELRVRLIPTMNGWLLEPEHVKSMSKGP